MDEVIKYLLDETGILGAVLAISLMANVTLYRRNQSLQDDRVKDAREDRHILISTLKDVTKATEQNTQAIYRLER